MGRSVGVGQGAPATRSADAARPARDRPPEKVGAGAHPYEPSGDDRGEMTTAADDSAVEDAFEAFLAGRPVPEEAAGTCVAPSPGRSGRRRPSRGGPTPPSPNCWPPVFSPTSRARPPGRPDRPGARRARLPGPETETLRHVLPRPPRQVPVRRCRRAGRHRGRRRPRRRSPAPAPPASSGTDVQDTLTVVVGDADETADRRGRRRGRRTADDDAGRPRPPVDETPAGRDRRSSRQPVRGGVRRRGVGRDGPTDDADVRRLGQPGRAQQGRLEAAARARGDDFGSQIVSQWAHKKRMTTDDLADEGVDLDELTDDRRPPVDDTADGAETGRRGRRPTTSGHGGGNGHGNGRGQRQRRRARRPATATAAATTASGRGRGQVTAAPPSSSSTTSSTVSSITAGKASRRKRAGAGQRGHDDGRHRERRGPPSPPPSAGRPGRRTSTTEAAPSSSARDQRRDPRRRAGAAVRAPRSRGRPPGRGRRWPGAPRRPSAPPAVTSHQGAIGVPGRRGDDAGRAAPRSRSRTAPRTPRCASGRRCRPSRWPRGRAAAAPGRRRAASDRTTASAAGDERRRAQQRGLHRPLDDRLVGPRDGPVAVGVEPVVAPADGRLTCEDGGADQHHPARRTRPRRPPAGSPRW